MGRKDSLPEDAPAPRLCELVKRADFQGYGFNLHSEKGKEGQFIGKIDAQSPAEMCGLQEGDLIVEVNGVNTSNENHKQVVSRIKTHADHAKLLVIDPKAAEYYKKRNITVSGSLANVKHMKSVPPGSASEEAASKSESSAEGSAKQGDSSDEPPPPPVPPKTELASEEQSAAAPAPSATEETTEPEAKSETEPKLAEDKPAEEKSEEQPAGKEKEKVEESKPNEGKDAEKKAEEDKPAEKSEEEKVPEKSEEKAPEDAPEGASDKKSEKAQAKEATGAKDSSPTIDTSLQVETGSDRTQPSPAPSAGSTSTVESAKSAESGSTAAETDKFGLKLNMTAAEMREYLKSKKRHDPRNDNLTFKQRHQIVQNM